MKNNRIYLLGFMGSGKSYLGKQLAKKLHWNFLDLDDFLENKEGLSISQIFEKGGESLFRDLERNYLQATIDFNNTVIATGGGAPCFFNNIEWMQAQGTTIYLKTAPAILVNRLRSEMAHRPLIAGKTESELFQFIEQKLNERSCYYEQAAIIFEYRSGLEGVEALVELLQKVE